MKANHILLILVAILLHGCFSRPSSNNYSKQDHSNIPQLYARVNDYAYLLSAEEENDLNQLLKSFEDSVGSQLAILTIDTLADETIEAYSLRVANHWRLGRAQYNDGILITLALKHRQVRIEVGYGLELIIEDHIAQEIIDSTMIPEFKSKDYYSGLKNGSLEIIDLIYNHPELIGQEYQRE
jgi:uncharacterized protein